MAATALDTHHTDARLSGRKAIYSLGSEGYVVFQDDDGSLVPTEATPLTISRDDLIAEIIGGHHEDAEMVLRIDGGRGDIGGFCYDDTEAIAEQVFRKLGYPYTLPNGLPEFVHKYVARGLCLAEERANDIRYEARHRASIGGRG